MAQGLVASSDVRTAICQTVRDNPGIHFRGLERAANLSSAGQLRHHIDRLSRQGRLVEVTDGGYKRFFLVGDHDRNLRPRLARFARPLPRRIATLLLGRSMNRTELRRSLGCADSTLGYYLKRMVRHGDLARHQGRNCCQYALVDPESVRQVLRLHDGGPDEEGLETAAPNRPEIPLQDAASRDGVSVAADRHPRASGNGRGATTTSSSDVRPAEPADSRRRSSRPRPVDRSVLEAS